MAVSTRAAMLCVLALQMFTTAQATKADTRPNIWFILSDDQGWNSIGFHNPDLITPNINQLVKEGRELGRHYVYKFCSPTRSSLISGRLPIHVNQENSATEQPLAGIPAGMTTMSERLAATGYSCHQVGKWHCGMASDAVIPKGRGFNTSLGFFNFGEDHYTQIRGGQAQSQEAAPKGACGPAVDLWSTDKPAYGINGTYGGYIYTKEAIRVVKERDTTRPFFLFTAFQNIHPPLEVPGSYVAQYTNKTLATTVNGMVTFLDESVGNITDVIKSEGIWDNTLIVFSADNGGYLGNGGDDTPRRGGKFGDFEGGTRVNAFASGGVIPAAVRGTEVAGMVHICDWFATFLHLAGNDDVYDPRAKAHGLPQPDSINVWGLISTSNSTSPRVELVLSALPGDWEPHMLNESGYRDPMYYTGGEAIIQGDWKLILGQVHKGPFGPNINATCDSLLPPWTPQNPGVPCSCGDQGCLFNIVQDPNEETNLASSMQDKVSAMQARLGEVRDTVYAPNRGDLDPKACDANKACGGYWSPWM